MRKHISEDGQVRNCTAKTPETCTAKGPDGEKAEHFSDYYAAKRRSEEIQEEKYGRNPSLSKKSQNFNTVPKRSAQEYPKTPVGSIKAKLADPNSSNWNNLSQKELGSLPPEEWKKQQNLAIKKMGTLLHENKKLAALQKAYRRDPSNKKIAQIYFNEAVKTGYIEEDKMRRVANQALAQEASLKEINELNAHLVKHGNPSLNNDVTNFVYNNSDPIPYEAYQTISEDDWAADREAAIKARDFLIKNKSFHKIYRDLNRDYMNKRDVAPSTLAYKKQRIKKIEEELSRNPTNEETINRLYNEQMSYNQTKSAIERTGKSPEVLETEYINSIEKLKNSDSFIGIAELNRRIDIAENALMSYGYDSIERDHSIGEY